MNSTRSIFDIVLLRLYKRHSDQQGLVLNKKRLDNPFSCNKFAFLIHRPMGIGNTALGLRHYSLQLCLRLKPPIADNFRELRDRLMMTSVVQLQLTQVKSSSL